MPLTKEKMMTKELARNTRNSGMESFLGWDPFSAVFSRRPVDRFFGGGFPFAGISDALESDFNVRIVDNGDSKQFKYPLPGVSKDNIKIEIVDNVLSVQVREANENGEHSYYSKVTLDSNLDLENITADSKDGLLVVSIPIKEQTTRHIPINIGERRESLESGSVDVSQPKESSNDKDSAISQIKEKGGSTNQTG
jgi:HSP20 family molecular chaperone IbpA